MTKQEILIEVRDLSKKFDDFIAVNHISLDIPKGKVFGFLGPNGAGKTTSLKMITGLLKPTSGIIKIDGKESKPNSVEFKTRLGLIPQDLVLWNDLTVEENMQFVAALYKIDKENAKTRIDQLINEIHLEEKKKTLVKNLSGGLKRRLNIILGLVHDPDIVVCDEPTPGLDPQSRALVWEFIDTLAKKKNKTVILTTHFMDEADTLSDIITIIDHGELLVTDTPEALKNSIGEGDQVEISLNDDNFLEMAKEKLEAYKDCEDVKLVDSKIQIRALNAPSKLAGIFNQIEAIEGLEVVDMKIRKTTLEDVFLHLTGRNLRE